MTHDLSTCGHKATNGTRCELPAGHEPRWFHSAAAAPRCFARTCGTCWVCTAAAEQARAVADRRWSADWTPTLVMTSPPCWLTPRGRIVEAPADVQARVEAERALDALCDATDEDERQMAAAIAVVLGGLFT